jgi:hypothetical protein
MPIEGFFTFICFVVALNLFIIGATGRVYDFTGRRGSAKYAQTVNSRSIRLGAICLAAIFLTVAIILANHLLR